MTRPYAQDVTIPIGQRLAFLRESSKLTAKAVARQLFVTPATVRAWEHGRRVPSVAMVEAYLRVVGGTITLGVQE